MADLSTTYLGLSLRNPLIVGSSGLTATVEGVRRCAEAGAGAVVLKSIFEEQIEHDAAEHTREVTTTGWHAEAEDYVARYGREGAVDRYLELIRSVRAAVDLPVIASVHCVTAGAWTDFAARAEQAGADALELNVFVLPADPGRDAEEIESLYFDVARAVTRKVSIPVALKVGPYFSSLSRTLIDLSRTGIRGLVLFNRFFPIDFDLETMQIVPGVIHSTPAEMHLPLRWISILSGRVACDLAASTGVHDAAGAIKQLLAGAAAVQLCSALYQNGVPHLATVLRELDEWLSRKDVRAVEQIRGALAQRGIGNPAAFERVQFMRTTGVE